MAGIVNQVAAAGQPVPGFAQRSVGSDKLGLIDGGLQGASFDAKKGTAYRFPTGGTVTLPAPTGSGQYIALTPYGTGTTDLSGVISAGGTIFSTFQISGDQTLIICDADTTRGWC